MSCLALVLAAPAALADVLVVAPSGAPFTQIADAVAAAQSGDIVLVKSGSYDHVDLWNKSVSIVAEAGASVNVLNGISIIFLGAANTVVLRGLTCPSPTLSGVSGFYVEACEGAIRVEECSFTGKTGGPYSPTDGAQVFGSSNVSFAHCTFVGGEGWAGFGATAFPPFDGFPGLAAYGSDVSLWQCTVTGGKGGDGGWGLTEAGTAGGIGGAFGIGTTVLDGCTLNGGQGGTGAKGIPAGLVGGEGGAAMQLASGLVRHTDTSFIPGAGGPGGVGVVGPSGPMGALGSAQIVLSGSVVQHLSTARDLTVNSPVRSGETATFKFGVVSCDAVFLLYSASTQQVWLGGPQGTLIPGPSFGMLALALPCATGTQPFAANIPPLPGGIEGVNVHLQALHSNSTEGLQLGSFTVLTLLDASIP